MSGQAQERQAHPYPFEPRLPFSCCSKPRTPPSFPNSPTSGSFTSSPKLTRLSPSTIVRLSPPLRHFLTDSRRAAGSSHRQFDSSTVVEQAGTEIVTTLTTASTRTSAHSSDYPRSFVNSTLVSSFWSPSERESRRFCRRQRGGLLSCRSLANPADNPLH